MERTLIVSAVALVAFVALLTQRVYADTQFALVNNLYKNGVNVEIRYGSDSSAESANNTAFGEHRFSGAEPYIFTANGAFVYYRRDADPDHPANPRSWTGWTSCSTTSNALSIDGVQGSCEVM